MIQLTEELKNDLTIANARKAQEEFSSNVEVATQMYNVIDQIEDGNIEEAKGILEDIIADVKAGRL